MMMRAEPNIPDDVDQAEPVDNATPFPCFVIAGPVPPITLEQTLAAEDEP